MLSGLSRMLRRSSSKTRMKGLSPRPCLEPLEDRRLLSISELTIPTVHSLPMGIASGPDGSLWFVEVNARKVGTINPTTHAITEYLVNSKAYPVEITAGQDGNLWFVDYGANAVGVATLPVSSPRSAASQGSIDGTWNGLSVSAVDQLLNDPDLSGITIGMRTRKAREWRN